MTVKRAIRLLLPVLAAWLLLMVLWACRPDDSPPGPEPTTAPTVAIAASATAVGGPAVVTATPVPGQCNPPPAGWQPYQVQPGDTLQALSARAGVSTARILNENCLADDTLIAGTTIYLPPLPASTPCVAGRAGWELVTVDIGDTLDSLAQARGTTAAEIMAANCLVSDGVSAGEQLYLPILPTPTPCLPPEGWDLYTVQLGDTLLGLAAARNVTSAEIVAANCLPALLVRPGDEIYLPPPPTPTPIPPAVAPAPPEGQQAQSMPQDTVSNNMPGESQQLPPGDAGPAGSVQSQSQAVSVVNPFEAMDKLVNKVDLTPRLPGQGNLRFCTDLANKKPVVEPVASPVLFLGQRLYFVTCWFDPTEALITRSDGIVWSVPIRTDSNFPLIVENEPRTLKTLQTGTFLVNPTAVVDWAALPFHPTGAYTLNITGTDQISPAKVITVSTVFTVTYPQVITPSILIVPAISKPAANVAVYYTNYPLTTQPEFTLLTTRTSALTSTLFDTQANRPWQVTIDQPWPASDRGWGFSLLTANNEALNGTYVISQITPSGVPATRGWMWFLKPQD